MTGRSPPITALVFQGDDPSSKANGVELEVPDYAAADEVVVLACLARIGQRQIWRAGPEVADLTANAEAMIDPDV
jgi:hypothetical protein